LVVDVAESTLEGRRRAQPVAPGVIVCRGLDRPDAARRVGPQPGHDVVTIDAGTSVFDAMAAALDFPDWFGGNWDALEDSLSDLAWRKAEGHVLLLRSYPAGDELGVLTDVLRAAAEYWAGRGKPFFAVFLDPQKRLALPELYRDA
jgi:hypothetical protein